MSGYFSDFRPKNFKKFSKLPSTCPEEHVVAWNFLKKVWIVLDFLRKPLAWFSKFYLVVQSKNCGKVFLFYFSELFRNLSERFSDFWPKNFKKLSKLPSTCVEEQFVAWNFFFIFLIVLDFLEKPLAWFSKFYLRVQSKNCGRIKFVILLFRILSEFEQKFFRLLVEKLQEVVKNNFCVCRRTIFGLNFFSKVLNRFGFSAENLAWFSSF